MLRFFLMTLVSPGSLNTDRFTIPSSSDFEFRKKCAKRTRDNTIGLPRNFSIPAKRRRVFARIEKCAGSPIRKPAHFGPLTIGVIAQNAALKLLNSRK
jgi:hypothetical protein